MSTWLAVRDESVRGNPRRLPRRRSAAEEPLHPDCLARTAPDSAILREAGFVPVPIPWKAAGVSLFVEASHVSPAGSGAALAKHLSAPACVPRIPLWHGPDILLSGWLMIRLERFEAYGIFRTMSSDQLSPTSYLVLGLLAREGPSTPYDLKRHVAATLGHFWSFPHALLYAEPPRLVALELATETREQHGRRRRIFTITDAGLDALRAWLDRPSREPTQLRDPGLLQLFFADLGSPDARHDIAREQLAIHRAKLAGYEPNEGLERRLDGAGAGHRTVEHWRGQTLRMGVLYERAAVDFWEGVAAGAAVDEAAATRAPAEDDGTAIASTDPSQDGGGTTC